MIELEMTDELFQSTLPAWGETWGSTPSPPRRTISIHSPRMGRDRHDHQHSQRQNYFNPLSPHGERRLHAGAVLTGHGFQSTLPAWGETRRGGAEDDGKSDFNPLSPHGERRELLQQAADKLLFQSTLPAWGETRPPLLPPWPCCAISIHSPRMGRDRRIQHAGIAQRAFQSTLPAWGETCTRYLA